MTEATTDQVMNVPHDRSAGRKVRSVLGYALATAFMFISPLVLFVPAALFNCALRNGRRAAVVALVLSVALLAAVFVRADSLQAAHEYSGTANVLELLFVIGVPALLLFSLVRRGVSFGTVVLAGTGASIGGLLATELTMRGAASWSPYQAFLLNFRESSLHWLEIYRQNKMPEDALKTMKVFSEKMADSFMPTMLIAPTVLMFVLSLVMLSRLPAWRDYVSTHLEPGMEKLRTGPYLFRNLRMPDWVIVAFLIGGISPLLSGMLQKIGGNVLAIVGFLYLLQGLAVFRSLLVTIGVGVTGVFFAYTILALLTMSGIAPLLLSIAGLFDSFFDFRHFNRKDDSNESHID